MDAIDVVGVRVLGSLIEKEVTTPDNYPLTLNALVSACNQATNREPVLALDEATVLASLDDLMRRSLVRQLYRSDSRARRYRQVISETLSLHPAETAVMGVLMLRGAQTAGEIRSRTARLFEFRDTAHVDITLRTLMTLTDPLVTQLPRRPGQKEARFAHLLSGEPPEASIDAETASPLGLDRAALDRAAPDRVTPDRVAALEESVIALRAEMAELRTAFDAFRREFQ